MRTQHCKLTRVHSRHTWDTTGNDTMALCPGRVAGEKCPECQGRPGADRIWGTQPDDTPTFDVDEVFPEPNPVITDGSYQAGDLIEIPAKVSRVTPGGTLIVQYDGVSGERTLSGNVTAELIHRPRKSPGRRAYEAAPNAMGTRPWGELDDTEQLVWNTIAKAAREDS